MGGGREGANLPFTLSKGLRQLFYMKKLMMEKCEPVHPDFFNLSV